MPSFLKDLKELRRKSRASISKTPSNGSNGSSENNIPMNKSTSSLSSALGSTTPPSTLPSEVSSSNLQSSTPTNGASPQRPGIAPPNGKRYSSNVSWHGDLVAWSHLLTVQGLNTLTTNGSPKSYSSTSPLAPQVLSVSDNSWVWYHCCDSVDRPNYHAQVHQKVLLIYGQIGDPAQQALDGNITVCHHQDSFPPTYWPVCDSHFKALVHLQPGPNRLRLDYTSPRTSSTNGSLSSHSSWINVNYLPLNSSPPLDLAILLARDSPGTFDAVPERIQREGNGLDTAIRKFRMAAYLWQAFTGEQMNRNSFGRRCFRYDEEWQPTTLTNREPGQMRNEAKIHLIRTDKNVEEIRDLDRAQQYEKGKNKGDLFSIASDAVRAYFQPRAGQKRYVSVLILDAHWDPKVKTIRGHAALGGGDGQIQLAIFGSQALQSYPSSIEEVVPAFTDCTRTDTSYVANDCNEAGSNWEAANIGIGAHLHETGHLLGCPHQEYGVMLRDYVRLNRTFICREPYSTRTRQAGQRLCLPKDECCWHRLDTLRFRFHPCFRLPNDPPLNPDESVQVWAVDNGNVLATAATGIAFIEIYAEGDDVCKAHFEYIDGFIGVSSGPPRQIVLTDMELRARLPESKRNGRLKLEIHSVGQGKHVVEDFAQLNNKSSRVKLPDGRWGFRGGKLGFSQLEGSRPQEVILQSAYIQTKLLTQIKVYHGFALDGIEFIYEDWTSQLFGNRGGNPGAANSVSTLEEERL